MKSESPQSWENNELMPSTLTLRQCWSLPVRNSQCCYHWWDLVLRSHSTSANSVPTRPFRTYGATKNTLSKDCKHHWAALESEEGKASRNQRMGRSWIAARCEACQLGYGISLLWKADAETQHAVLSEAAQVVPRESLESWTLGSAVRSRRTLTTANRKRSEGTSLEKNSATRRQSATERSDR